MIGLARELIKDLKYRSANFFLFLFGLKYFFLVGLALIFGVGFSDDYVGSVYISSSLNLSVSDLVVVLCRLSLMTMLVFFMYDLMVSYLTFNIYVLNDKKIIISESFSNSVSVIFEFFKISDLIKNNDFYEKIKSQLSEFYEKYIYGTEVYTKFSFFYDALRVKTRVLRKKLIKSIYKTVIPNRDFNGFFSKIFIIIWLIAKYTIKALVALLKITWAFLKPYLILLFMILPLAFVALLIASSGDSIAAKLQEYISIFDGTPIVNGILEIILYLRTTLLAIATNSPTITVILLFGLAVYITIKILMFLYKEIIKMIKFILVALLIVVVALSVFLICYGIFNVAVYVNANYVKPTYTYTMTHITSPIVNSVDSGLRENPEISSAISEVLPYFLMLLLAFIFLKLRAFGFLARLFSYLYLYFVSASLVVGAASNLYLIFFSFILLLSIKGRVKAKYFYIFFISFFPYVFVNNSLTLPVFLAITAIMVITDYEIIKDNELATEKDFFFNAYLGKYKTLLNKSIDSQDYNPA